MHTIVLSTYDGGKEGCGDTKAGLNFSILLAFCPPPVQLVKSLSSENILSAHVEAERQTLQQTQKSVPLLSL